MPNYITLTSVEDSPIELNTDTIAYYCKTIMFPHRTDITLSCGKRITVNEDFYTVDKKVKRSLKRSEPTNG